MPLFFLHYHSGLTLKLFMPINNRYLFSVKPQKLSLHSLKCGANYSSNQNFYWLIDFPHHVHFITSCSHLQLLNYIWDVWSFQDQKGKCRNYLSISFLAFEESLTLCSSMIWLYTTKLFFNSMTRTSLKFIFFVQLNLSVKNIKIFK